MSETSALDRLAAHYGIEPAFTDNWGRRHVVSAATKRALLAAMGVPVASDAELAASLRAARGRGLARGPGAGRGGARGRSRSRRP